MQPIVVLGSALVDAADRIGLGRGASVPDAFDARVQTGLRTSGGRPPLPVTDQELLVLRLLADGLTLREVGERAHLSINTVKTHARHLYRKLGVNSRDEAVRVWWDHVGREA